MQQAAYQFQGFELSPSRRVLQLHGTEVAVTPRAFDVLLALVERAGRVVTKNELFELVWPKVVVEENNLQVQISTLRKLLGPRAIATVPGRGYTFTLLPGAGRAAPAEAHRRDDAKLPPGNLPAQLPPLYGRNEDIVALAQMLQSHRVVTVVGPAGIGKTRLAQAVAYALRRGHADGVWLVELAPLTDALLVVPTVARVLGYAIAPNEAALSALVDALGDRLLLLVLDNCEHLLASVAELATQIVAGAPNIRLLVTSQEPLHIAEERVDRLNALAVPATVDVASALNYGAVELFVARAQSADPRFVLNGDNGEAVVEICKRLDGIPLAIELAAARIPLLGVHGLRRRIDEQLRLLSGGVRTALPRQQTLRAALQWSHALLSSEERTVFDRLGVFVGSFSLEAAQRVACDEAIDPWAVLDHLATLVDKSLVLAEGGDVPRYRLLESNRALLLERLAAAGVTEQLQRRHAQVIADTLMGEDPMEGPSTRVHRIAPDLDNVRAAAAWATGPTGDRTIAIALAGASDMLWDARVCPDEGLRLCRLVEPWVDESVPLRLAARYWFAVSNLRVNVEISHQAKAGLKAVELFRRLEDRMWLFRALQSMALKFSWLCDRDAAQKALAEMQDLQDPSWPSWTRLAVENGLANCEYFAAQRPAEARRHFEAAIELHRRFGGDPYFAYHSELILVSLENDDGAFEVTVRRAQNLLARCEAGLGARVRPMILTWKGAALASLGHLQEAEELLRAAIPLLRHALGGSAQWGFYYVAYLLALQARAVDAARIVGYIDSFSAATISTRMKRRCYESTLAMVGKALPANELDGLRAEGRRLTEDEAIALAFPRRSSTPG